MDKKEAVKEADPQSASMAKAIGADQSLIAALSVGFFAIAIEFGSGVGFWLVFGHAGPRPRAEVDPPHSLTELVPVEPPRIPLDEKPADIVDTSRARTTPATASGRGSSTPSYGPAPTTQVDARSVP